MLREQILLLLGTSGEENFKSEAFKRFEAALKGSHPLPADLRVPVYATVLCHGGQQAYDDVMKIYDQEDAMEEKSRIERLLGMAASEDLLQRTLEFSLSAKVRSQDTIFILAGVTRSLRGRQMLWQFVQKNWDDLYHRYGTSVLLGRIVQCLTNYVCKEETASEIKTFFDQHECKAASRSLCQGMEHIQSNIAFLKAQGNDIAKFLQALE